MDAVATCRAAPGGPPSGLTHLAHPSSSGALVHPALCRPVIDLHVLAAIVVFASCYLTWCALRLLPDWWAYVRWLAEFAPRRSALLNPVPILLGLTFALACHGLCLVLNEPPRARREIVRYLLRCFAHDEMRGTQLRIRALERVWPGLRA